MFVKIYIRTFTNIFFYNNWIIFLLEYNQKLLLDSFYSFLKFKIKNKSTENSVNKQRNSNQTEIFFCFVVFVFFLLNFLNEFVYCIIINKRSVHWIVPHFSRNYSITWYFLICAIWRCLNLKWCATTKFYLLCRKSL